MHAAQDNHVGVRFGGLLGKGKGVTGEVGNTMENFGCLVIVGQDHGMALGFEGFDGRHVRRVHGPLRFENDCLQAFVARCQSRRQLRRIRLQRHGGRGCRRLL